MWINNLKIALRTLRKNSVYTGINILGLTVGIAAALLIYHMVSYELSFNKNFSNYDRIVRVVQVDRSTVDGPFYNVCVPIPAGEQMRDRISQFEYMTRIHELFSMVTVPEEGTDIPLKKFRQGDRQTAFFAEPEFFKIFDFEWLAGDVETAIDAPGTIVLTKTWAEKCFDQWENAMGQKLMLDNLVPVEVKGVVEDLPANADFPLPFIVSYETVKNNPDLFFYQDSWGNCSSNDQVFALLKENTSIDDANSLVADIGKEEYTNESGVQERMHHLQPLSELHYDERYGHSGTHTIAKGRLKVLGIIGALILLIASFNFINLATAQSLIRAKEVGVRKTLGSSKQQLITQFMTETGLIVLSSVVLGTGLAVYATPLLQHVSFVPDNLGLFDNTTVFPLLGLATVVITFIAGFYPAMALSSYRPVEALNHQSSQNSIGAAAIRKALVVLQFGAALALIISALITLKQLDFMRNSDLGFNKELIYTFTFNNDEKSVSQQNVLKQYLRQIPSVQEVSLSSDQPFSGNTWDTNFKYGAHPEDEPFDITLKFCDVEYFGTYGFEFLAGKPFSVSDTMHQCVINMKVLSKLGIDDPNEAIGEYISLGGGRRKLPIMGVVKDFHTHTFRQQLRPLLMTSRREFYYNAGVKISSTDIPGTIASIRDAYDKVLPEQVFQGSFLDEDIQRFYENDNRLAATCWAFGILAIFISCLGLFGLATHSVTQRVKEIGIRKVLGANVAGIVALLSRDFLTLVVIALLVASPIAWYVMNGWLENFAYRIDIQWWIFFLAGAMALVIAFLTVSYQSIRAALANPVKSLRNE